jgi:hypothetical protein
MHSLYVGKSPHIYLVEVLINKTGTVLSTSRTVHPGRYSAAKGENQTETEDEEQAYRSNNAAKLPGSFVLA